MKIGWKMKPNFEAWHNGKMYSQADIISIEWDKNGSVIVAIPDGDLISYCKKGVTLRQHTTFNDLHHYDIVRFPSGRKCLVEWSDKKGQWVLIGEDGLESCPLWVGVGKKAKKIGNIFENEELFRRK